MDFVASSGKEVQPLGPPGMFDNFGTGLGDATMQGLARTGRAASMVMAAPVVIAERNANLARRVRGVPESHDLTDRYFREVTEDLTGGVVSYSTPDAANVDAAGQTLNSLVSSLVPPAGGAVPPSTHLPPHPPEPPTQRPK